MPLIGGGVHPIDYEWIEVDSATSPVDDVVVGRADGTTIHCQCKKNSPTHTAWSVGSLKDELQKAAQLLSSKDTAVVRYYSRTPFGELEVLKEFSTNYPDRNTYRSNLGAATKVTDEALEKLLSTASPNLSTYDFLQRTWFEPTPSLERMQELLQERLRNLASNPASAYHTLRTHLAHLGMRVNTNGNPSAAIRHRLSKADIKSILVEAGAMLTAPKNIDEIRAVFESTSAIGRNWCRDISGAQIPNPLVDEIMSAIGGKSQAFLVTGSPGSGKTCVMLALQDALEKRSQTTSDIQPFFIQSREFADLNSAQERQAMGLKEQWVECVARMADTVHTTVVIDSLDVLSIAREHKMLDYFLAQIDRLLHIPNVTVITACRDFDRQYDRRIVQRKWDKEFKCTPWNWESEIAPLLNKLRVDTSTIDTSTRELISNPRELALFVELAQRDGSFNVVTSQALAQRYLHTIVRENHALGDAAMQAIKDAATEMLKQRSLAISAQRFTASQDIQRALLSHQILQLTQDGKLTFGHQTLLDVLVVSGAIRQGITLDAFIRNLSPVPFVRPSIRSFVAQLAAEDRRIFRRQLRTVLTGNHTFHIRRLVAECLAGQIPQDDDWPLIRDLKAQHPEVFQVIYFQSVQVE
jgi:ATPase family associated with various cellular activities (AAA)